MVIKGSEAAIPECCMCGDPGFSDQLFRCKFCHFRSQHRYCSNLYPKARSYVTCNWCLIQTDQIADKSPNSSNSSSSFKDNNGNAAGDSRNKKTKNGIDGPQFIIGVGGKRGIIQPNKPVKKQRSPEAESPPSTSPPVLVSTRKRIITNGDLEERLRRTKSEDISNRNGITKQVFRNKARRYKLLDEVIS